MSGVQNTIYSPTHSTREYFLALMEKLSKNQVTALLKAVRSRVEPQAANCHCVCILIRSTPLVYGEELQVVMCRLFLWNNLRDTMQLKRLPACPADPVYVCCNPLHWYRILDTEIAPPPYQQLRMEELLAEGGVQNSNSEHGTNCIMASSGSNISGSSYLSSTFKSQSGLCVQIPESLTTDGEGGGIYSLAWCEVAYWEMSKRVGDRFFATKSSFNVYFESMQSIEMDEGMCLKELTDKDPAQPMVNAQYNRKKIGLGITLSKEANGVWLYNRSTVPIFIYSPSLSANWLQVCRVKPGECLLAFDSHRAQSYVNALQFSGTQIGPVDMNSMRISFAKGWGSCYKRQDITACPCWLDITFTQR